MKNKNEGKQPAKPKSNAAIKIKSAIKAGNWHTCATP
jgi:hypothetical protein